MIKLMLCLCCIVIPNCQLTELLQSDAISTLKRVIRQQSTGVSPVVFNKLSQKENAERMEKCGIWNTNDSNIPWLAGITTYNKTLPYTESGVFITNRHLITGKHIPIHLSSNSIFGGNFDLAEKTEHSISTLVPRNPSNSSESAINVIWGPSNQTVSPVKIYINVMPTSDHNYVNKIFAILELADDVSDITPICLPAKETEMEKDYGYVQGYEDRSLNLIRDLIDSRRPVSHIWMKYPSQDMRKPYSQYLAKEENSRLVIDGFYNEDWDYKGDWIGYSIVLRRIREFCALIGACPRNTLPLEDLGKITEKENSERSEECGTVSGNSSDDANRTFPWVVKIERFPGGTVHTGVVISQRHIFTDANLFRDFNLQPILNISNSFKDNLSISTTLPLKDFDSTTLLNFQVSVTDNSLQLQPDKIWTILDGSEYVILEMSQNLNVTPVCLSGLVRIGDGDEVLSMGHGTSSRKEKIASINATGTIFLDPANQSINPSLTQMLFQRHLDRFMLVGYHERNASSTSPSTSTFQSLSSGKTDGLCQRIGVCYKDLLELPSIQVASLDFVRITDEENAKRFGTCGDLGNRTAGTQPKFARDAPWLVKITTNLTEFSGFLISSRHVLLGTDKLDRENGTRIFPDFSLQNGGSEIYSGSMPNDSPSWRVSLDVCDNGTDCDSPQNLNIRVAKIFYIRQNLNVAILELADDVSNVTTICMPSEMTKTGDRVMMPSLEDVASISRGEIVEKVTGKLEYIYLEVLRTKTAAENAYLLTKISASPTGNRTMAIGLSPRASLTANTKFLSIGQFSRLICSLTGVCPTLSQSILPIREILDSRRRKGSKMEEYTDEEEFDDPPDEDFIEIDDDEPFISMGARGGDLFNVLFVSILFSWF